VFINSVHSYHDQIRLSLMVIPADCSEAYKQTIITEAQQSEDVSWSCDVQVASFAPGVILVIALMDRWVQKASVWVPQKQIITY